MKFTLKDYQNEAVRDVLSKRRMMIRIWTCNVCGKDHLSETKAAMCHPDVTHRDEPANKPLKCDGRARCPKSRQT